MWNRDRNKLAPLLERGAMPVVTLVSERYRKLIADGLGEKACPELIRLYRGSD